MRPCEFAKLFGVDRTRVPLTAEEKFAMSLIAFPHRVNHPGFCSSCLAECTSSGCAGGAQVELDEDECDAIG